MSECTAEIAAGDQIAHRMNDFHDKVTAAFSDLEQQIIHKFDIRKALDAKTRTITRWLWLSCLTLAVLEPSSTGVTRLRGALRNPG